MTDYVQQLINDIQDGNTGKYNRELAIQNAIVRPSAPSKTISAPVKKPPKLVSDLRGKTRGKTRGGEDLIIKTPGLTKKQQETMNNLEIGAYDAITQGNATSFYKKVVQNDKFKDIAEKISDNIIDYEVKKNPKVNNTEEALKFLSGKFTGANKSKFWNIIEQSDIDVNKVKAPQTESMEDAPVSRKTGGKPRDPFAGQGVRGRDLGKILDTKEALKEDTPAEPGAINKVIESIIGSVKDNKDSILQEGMKLKKATDKEDGLGSGIFRWILDAETGGGFETYDSLLKKTPLGWNEDDQKMLDRMMNDDPNVTTGEAWKVIGKIIANPTKLGDVIETRTKQWSNKQLSKVKNFFEKISVELKGENKQGAERVTALLEKNDPYLNYKKLREKQADKAKYGGTAPSNIELPSRPTFIGTDLSGLKSIDDERAYPTWWDSRAGQALNFGDDYDGYYKYISQFPEQKAKEDERVRQVKLNRLATPGDLLDERGKQLAERMKDTNRLLMKKMKSIVGREDWTASDVDEFYDEGDAIAKLDDTTTYDELLELWNKMIRKIPKDVWSDTDVNEAVNTLKSDLSAKLAKDKKVTNAFDTNYDYKTDDEIKQQKEQDKKAKAKEDKDGGDKDGDGEDGDKSENYGVRNIGKLASSELRPKLPLGGEEEIFVPTPEERFITDMVWNKVDLVSEGFGEGTRSENKLFRHQLQHDAMRYGKTFKGPEVPPPRNDQQPLSFIKRNQPILQDVYQGMLPSGIPDFQGNDYMLGLQEDSYPYHNIISPSDSHPRGISPEYNFNQTTYNDQKVVYEDRYSKNVQIPVTPFHPSEKRTLWNSGQPSRVLRNKGKSFYY
jgi:hypothetical protein